MQKHPLSTLVCLGKSYLSAEDFKGRLLDLRLLRVRETHINRKQGQIRLPTNLRSK